MLQQFSLVLGDKTKKSSEPLEVPLNLIDFVKFQRQEQQKFDQAFEAHGTGTSTIRASARNSDHKHGTVTSTHTPPKPNFFNATAIRSDKPCAPSRPTKRIRSSLNNGDRVAPLLFSHFHGGLLNNGERVAPLLFSRFHGGLLPTKLARMGSPPCIALVNHSSILSSFMVFAEDHIRPGKSIANPTPSGLRLGCRMRPAWKMCAFIPLATIRTGASEKIAS